MHEDTDNFTTRLKVETTYAPGEVRDHRDGFQQQQYRRNLQADNRPHGMQPMGEVTGQFKMPDKPVNREPKPVKSGARPQKSVADKQLEEANKKDLKKRNLKNQ